MRALLTSVAFVLAGAAVAEPLPQFDVEKGCRATTSRSVFGSKVDEEAYERCLVKTKDTYEMLKGEWPQLYPNEQASCLYSASGTAPSISSIHYCARWKILERGNGRR